jgi:DNA polymerase-1
MEQTGLSEKEAKSIEAKYHALYEHSDKFVADVIQQATIDGYVTVAFGLRVRTPLLHRSLLNTNSTPHLTQAEARTAGNAIGQAYGMLNNRALHELRKRLKRSAYRYLVRPCAQIHDAIYTYNRDLPEVIEWLNTNLIECMQWQELDAIKHDEVHLGAELDIFYPNWSTSHTLKNNMSLEDITNKLRELQNETINI